MDIEHMIGQMVLGSLGGRRKRSRRTARFLTGGRNSFLNASTLMTLGGLAWGVFETMSRKDQGGQFESAAGFPPAGGTPASRPTPAAPAGLVTPPPLPQSVSPAPVPAGVPEGAARIVRLMIAAARADGSLAADERAAILEQASAAGLDALASAEIDRPTPLDAIVSGITDGAQRKDLYTLAFSIVRADEQVTGAERIFLARLASLIDLDPAAVADLEQKAAAGIDAAEEQKEQS
jgi:uncharacterized membrane protein YebE (DUF533 family)